MNMIFALKSRGEKKEEPSGRKPGKPVLSVKEKLDNASLREILNSMKKGKWSALEDEIDVTIRQLKQMDTYQERLHGILDQNDVKALSDTEEILDQAEQVLCQNVRKVINYMNVLNK